MGETERERESECSVSAHRLRVVEKTSTILFTHINDESNLILFHGSNSDEGIRKLYYKKTHGDWNKRSAG